MRAFKIQKNDNSFDIEAECLANYCKNTCLEYAQKNVQNDKKLTEFLLNYKGFYAYYDFLISRLNYKIEALFDRESMVSIKNNMFFIDNCKKRYFPFFSDLNVFNVKEDNICNAGFILPNLIFVGSNIYDHSEIAASLLQVILINNIEILSDFNSLGNYFYVLSDYLIYRLGCIKVAGYSKTDSLIYNPLIINKDQKELIEYLKDFNYSMEEVSYFLDNPFAIRKKLSKVKFK